MFICRHLCLNMNIYLYVWISISPSSLESAQEYPGEKIMIRFVERSFPGCLSDSRQVSTWHGFQFSQPQQFQHPHHNSAWGYLFVGVPLVDFFKCLGLPVMFTRCSWVVCLELKKPKFTYHFVPVLTGNQYIAPLGP